MLLFGVYAPNSVSFAGHPEIKMPRGVGMDDRCCCCCCFCCYSWWCKTALHPSVRLCVRPAVLRSMHGRVIYAGVRPSGRFHLVSSRNYNMRTIYDDFRRPNCLARMSGWQFRPPKSEYTRSRWLNIIPSQPSPLLLLRLLRLTLSLLHFNCLVCDLPCTGFQLTALINTAVDTRTGAAYLSK